MFALIKDTDSIMDRFNFVCARYPNATAIVSSTERWSYRELAEKAARIASLLIQECGGSNDPVALLFPHEASMIAAILGALGAGKCYVPLMSDEPVGRLKAILGESKCSSVLVSSELAGIGQELFKEVHVIDERKPASISELTGTRSSASLTYILYTSGTTGSPKGVCQNDRNVLHHAACYASAIELRPSDRMTLLPFYGFDASVMDIFATLLTGASLYIWDLRRDGSDSYEVICGDLVEYLKGVEPGAFDTILCFGVLSHLIEHIEIMREVSRIAPGTFILDTWVALEHWNLRERLRNYRVNSFVTRTQQGGTRGPGLMRQLQSWLANIVPSSHSRTGNLVFLYEDAQAPGATARPSGLMGWANPSLVEMLFDHFGLEYERVDWKSQGITDWTELDDYKRGARESWVARSPR